MSRMRRFSAGLSLFLMSAATWAQQVTLPGGTAIPVVTAEKIEVAELKSGSRVQLRVKRNVRSADGTLIVPANTLLSGTVQRVQTKPLSVEMSIAPLPLSDGANLNLEGNPLATTKKGKLVRTDDPSPKELDRHYRLSAGDVAALTGVGVVALPILAIASPFILTGALTGGDSKQIAEGHFALLKTTSAVTIPREALPTDPASYRGNPVIYIADRLEQHHRTLSCGTEPLLGDKHQDNINLRVSPATYTFRTERKDETSATVQAKQDGRYLIYHDHAGLHAIDLASRPDLVDRLPVVNEKLPFYFDTDKVTAEQQDAVARDRARGGCGLVKLLKRRPLQTPLKTREVPADASAVPSPVAASPTP